MADRDDNRAPSWLGPHSGTAVVVQSRKAQTTVHEHAEGWFIVSVRLRQSKPKPYFRAIINRCLLAEHCDRHRCLGHAPAVHALAATIRSTYE